MQDMRCEEAEKENISIPTLRCKREGRDNERQWLTWRPVHDRGRNAQSTSEEWNAKAMRKGRKKELWTQEDRRYKGNGYQNT